MIPSHIAFIMDGNGRWAERRGLPRKYGHKMGTETLEKTVKSADRIGVKIVTFYAFSTENWSRPQEEIDFLMETFRKFLKKKDKYKEKNYRVRFIGNLARFPEDIVQSCHEMCDETKDNDGILIVIALNYGSWEEITSAVNRLLDQGKRAITQQEIMESLYTHDIPFPDLVVRTGGEVRLSNFLLLQSAYSELLFFFFFFPDFNEKALKSVISEYENRERKYGGLSKKNVEA